jgi:uncharacterized membrane protein
MTLEPLLSASPAIIMHAFAAMAAFGIGLVQIAGPKGTTTHRILGWGWVAIMLTVAISSFWIQGMKQFGNFSWIHGLSILVLIMLPLAVLAARRHRVSAHKKTMISLFLGALVIAGLFTLLPGRIMHDVLFTNGSGAATR